MATNRTAAQILAEWHARNNTCPPGVECEHHGPMATDEPDCAACWLAAAEKRAKASEEMTYDEQVQVIARRCGGGLCPVVLEHDGADWWAAETGDRVGGGPTIRVAAASLFACLHGQRPDAWAQEHGDDELLRATEGLDEEGAEYGKDPQAH